MRQLHKHEQCKQSLVEISVYLGTEGGLETALRFLTEAETAFGKLCVSPEKGQACDFEHPKLQGLFRWFVLPSFPRFVVFYRFDSTEVSVVDVLHGARENLESLLASSCDKATP